jgi:hypothetical protein
VVVVEIMIVFAVAVEKNRFKKKKLVMIFLKINIKKYVWLKLL